MLPLIREPPPFSRQNQASALQHNEFVDQCVEDLLGSGCIAKVVVKPCICSPLSVVENSKGKKINLRHLNQYLWKQKFKYEDLRIAMLLFQKGNYLFSFDLKSGYHHIDIVPSHHKYLGFAWKQILCVYCPPIWPFISMLHFHKNCAPFGPFLAIPRP